MVQATLEISLFGMCVVTLRQQGATEIRGKKHRAMIALLATAPMGRLPRADLQTMLWGGSDYDAGHQNLRRALSDLRKLFGACFEQFFVTSNADIQLQMTYVRFAAVDPGGLFLADLSIPQAGFQDWLMGVRAAREPVMRQIAAPAPRPPRPVITALPLSVLDPDPQTRVMADWLAEETCRSLSRSGVLTVISHLSGREMATRQLSVAAIRDTLDVDYFLSGTMRREGDLMIADVDFVDARSAQILWNRHLRCPVAGFAAAVQGDLISLVRAIGRSVADSLLRYVQDRPLREVPDHQLIMAGVALMHQSTLRDFLRSRAYLREAAARMPAAAEPRAWLGKWYVLNVFKGLSANRDSDTRKALDCTAHALDLDPESSFGLTVDGFAHNNLLKRMDVAEARYAAALEVNPNESLSWLLRGALMAFQDSGAVAVEATQMAQRLSPIDPFGYYYDSLASTAYLADERYGDALRYAERSLQVNPRHISTLRAQITALYHLGRGQEARAAAGELMRRFPDFTMEDYRRSHPSAGHRLGRRVIEALTDAGLPEH